MNTADTAQQAAEHCNLSNTARRRNFDVAGNRLAHAFRARQKNPGTPELEDALRERTRVLLQCARDLPDNPERRPSGSRYKPSSSEEPSLSRRLFGVAYEYQRNPRDVELSRQLTVLAIGYFSQRRDQREAAAKQKKKAARRNRQQSGGTARRAEPGEWINHEADA